MLAFILRLKSSRAVRVHRGASSSDIAALCNCFVPIISTDYLRYVSECGWAEIGGDILYGLGPDATQAENVLEAIRFERATLNPMRDDLVPLMPDGAGNHYCLDLSDQYGKRNGHYPIVLWSHDHPKKAAQQCPLISPDLNTWVLSLISEAEDRL